MVTPQSKAVVPSFKNTKFQFKFRKVVACIRKDLKMVTTKLKTVTPSFKKDKFQFTFSKFLACIWKCCGAFSSFLLTPVSLLA